ncbi:hypothetical protein GWI33_017386 [Rhynchophorus ferrugineus]|uniref:Uncharacterized protein n=1 Tax=Rhynchophorus ferrugineus TaxID=354439 RepID=A0A834IW22_RHYFE|nr:hypothetical protein GWI33_017386 [Rhynchophorus ferrugineus]
MDKYASQEQAERLTIFNESANLHFYCLSEFKLQNSTVMKCIKCIEAEEASLTSYCFELNSKLKSDDKENVYRLPSSLSFLFFHLVLKHSNHLGQKSYGERKSGGDNEKKNEIYDKLFLGKFQILTIRIKTHWFNMNLDSVFY